MTKPSDLALQPIWESEEDINAYRVILRNALRIAHELRGKKELEGRKREEKTGKKKLSKAP